MSNILGLDLGTNSIGWAIRDTSVPGNQIINKGVLTFEKGVGEGKSGEFPLVQKRTESRSKRRNYQAEKYRKWELLRTLIQYNMVPLSLAELDSWQKYTKGIGRKYPQSEAFLNWLRFDFDGDGKPDFERLGFSRHENHYLFRMLAASEQLERQQIFQQNPHILGRVLYHLVQRRGFRGRDEEEARTISEGSKESGTKGVEEIRPYLNQYKTLGSALYHMHKQEGKRIRKRYNLRSDYEAELKEICRVQNLGDELYKKLHKAIIWQRPLRGQKGLVGYCTFEAPVKDENGKFLKAGKKRSPLSHPLYEEYRTWVFINNLKIELPEDINRLEYIREKIYPLFYNKSRDFKLSSISKELKKANGKITARFASDTKVISCTLLNAFKIILGDDWQENYGWNEMLTNQPKKQDYTIEDIWHVLQTFDSAEKLKEFATEKLGLPTEKVEEFSKIKLQQGYATLSLSAIKKLLPYLQRGFIYSEAVYLANMHRVLGKEGLSKTDITHFIEIFREVSTTQKNMVLIGTVVNSLISDQLNSDHRFGMDRNYQLDRLDDKDILNKIKETDGEVSWQRRFDCEREQLQKEISESYLNFLRQPINAVKDRLFVKVPRLHDRIFARLQQDYSLPDENKKELWHPSEQETYEKAKEIDGIKILGNPQPISNGFKNPMALKTLHQLKKLINYLLKERKIDEDTRIVVEIARELNDANTRKAIERWQRDHERENKEYRSRINEDCGVPLSSIKDRMVDKYRLWIEQNRQCLYTGKIINCADLFSSTPKFDLEHTIPASISFDDELKNLTIADVTYNREFKQNRMPTELENYEKDAHGYTVILPRIQFMFEKVETLEKQLTEWRNKAKFASTKDIKDACIQRQHYIKFDLKYWRSKRDTFTCLEYKAGWRNSQLRDTQVITKYALPYLKTVFNKVEVQKGTVTDKFKEIYKVKLKDEKKDRSKHSHHAIDAATLTLIPAAAIRDKIIKQYEEAIENGFGKDHHEPVKDWNSFHPEYLISIANDILINFQPQYRTVTPTFKNVRKRGKQQFVEFKDNLGKWQYRLDANGRRIPLVAKGDSIRGQLHKETFFGAIKQPEYEEVSGKFVPKTDGAGNFLFQVNEKRGDELFIVTKVPIMSFAKPEDFDVVIDPNLRKFLIEETTRRMQSGLSFIDALQNLHAFNRNQDKHGNSISAIRHVRCKVKSGGGGYVTNPAIIKQNATFPGSKKEYKQNLYALNGETILSAFYQDIINGEIVRIIEPYSILEIAKSGASNLNEAVPAIKEHIIKKQKHIVPLYAVLKIKQKVFFYEEEKEELKNMSVSELSKRLYLITKFEDGRISFKHHLNAMSEDELKAAMKARGLADVGASAFNFDEPIPKLRISKAAFDFVIEGKHFDILPDGEINWKF